MKVVVVGNKEDQEEVKRIMAASPCFDGLEGLEIAIVSEKEFEEINKIREEFLTTTIPMNTPTTIEFCKDLPEPIQEYNNPRNRHERRKLAAESRRK